jgi:hypothetical protein
MTEQDKELARKIINFINQIKNNTGYGKVNIIIQKSREVVIDVTITEKITEPLKYIDKNNNN